MKLATLHQVVFQVEFSLLLAFLGPLESSAVEKVRRMSLQYPTTHEAVYLCNGAVSEKSPQIFRPPWPAEYVTVFSGRTDAPEVRCELEKVQKFALRMCYKQWNASYTDLLSYLTS